MINSTIAADKAVAILDAIFAKPADERSTLVAVKDDYTPIMFATKVTPKTDAHFLFVEAGNYQATLLGDDMTLFLEEIDKEVSETFPPGKLLS